MSIEITKEQLNKLKLDFNPEKDSFSECYYRMGWNDAIEAILKEKEQSNPEQKTIYYWNDVR